MEGDLAAFLKTVAQEFPKVAMGSYPKTRGDQDGFRVKITLEGRNLQEVEGACARLLLPLEATREDNNV